MIKIFIFGITGKMGKLILNFIKLNKKIIIIGGVNRKNIFLIKKYNFIFNSISKKGVFIDFSSPIIIKKILFLSRYYNIALVIGTTGFNINELLFIKYFSIFIKLIISYNTSVGINIINFFIKKINFFLYKYNFNSIIIDIHHNKKKDSPSGTALIFYHKLKKININILYSRIKKIIGNHILYFISNYEIIKIEHFVLNKNIFIIGILYSIIWIIKKNFGLYSMQDVFF